MENSSLLVKKRNQPKTKLFMVIFIFTLVLVVVNQVYFNINSKQTQAYSQQVANLSVISQNLAGTASAVIGGDSDALSALFALKNEFQTAWSLIRNGSGSYVSTGLGFSAPLPGKGVLIDSTYPEFEQSWNNTTRDVDLIISNRDRITEIDTQSNALRTLIPVLQSEYSAVETSLRNSNLPLATVAAAERQGWLVERIGYNLDLITTGRLTDELASTFQEDIELFLKNHIALLEGSQAMGIARVANGSARENLSNVSAMLGGIQDPAAAIIAAIPDIEIIASAEGRISNNSKVLLAQIDQIGELISRTDIRDPNVLLSSPLVGYGLLFLLLLTILAYGRQVLRQSQEAEQVSAEKNSRNNEAVLKLLSEISNLGDGDLTVKATVGKDFTGAIADSINYAVQQLRELVAAITSATMEVTSSTEASRETVESLSKATMRQSESINSVNKSIREIGDGISQVNENAQKTLDVAKNSVKSAAGGAAVVKDTIKGMGNIREQIQDTSKRIKRLGESSQEIGGFVSLINDIAEHTNTLSLNAAIQAASAGDAGKGFAVVADEVHALAERSADATRQIENLVKVIQTDIKEAVKSMEETTAEVVAGTKLAKSAGTELDDIQRVSRELEELVDSINEASSNQSKAAYEITQSMDVIQEMTANTTSGVEATTEFMASLGALTDRLQNAVAGFSLEERQNKWSKYAADRTRQETKQEAPAFGKLQIDSGKEADTGFDNDKELLESARMMSA